VSGSVALGHVASADPIAEAKRVWRFQRDEVSDLASVTRVALLKYVPSRSLHSWVREDRRGGQKIVVGTVIGSPGGDDSSARLHATVPELSGTKQVMR
jgi:hypothetical protein